MDSSTLVVMCITSITAHPNPDSQSQPCAQVTEKLKQGVAQAIKKGQELDKEHHIVEKVKKGTADAITKAKEVCIGVEPVSCGCVCACICLSGRNALPEPTSNVHPPTRPTQINEEHHVTEKVAKGVVAGMNALTKVIKEGAKAMEKKGEHGKEGEGEGEGGGREYDFAAEAAKAAQAQQK